MLADVSNAMELGVAIVVFGVVVTIIVAALAVAFFEDRE